MLKLVIYAAMNRIYSSRDIRKACKRDINFMYLLEGMPAPDHATIARFISLHFSACAKVLLAQMSDLLYLLGEISGKTIFIDGTRLNRQPINIHLYGNGLLRKIRPGYTQN
jgi:transposase